VSAKERGPLTQPPATCSKNIPGVVGTRSTASPSLRPEAGDAGGTRPYQDRVADRLCTRCGLCCDGSLFADVELASNDEATALEVMGLAVEEDEEDRGLLLQPCGALKGKRCSIYAHRPDCCRTFECRLLQEVTRGEVTLDEARTKVTEALALIQFVQKLIVRLGGDPFSQPLKECCGEVLVAEDGDASDRKQKKEELEGAMSGLERFIRKIFLGNGRACGV
jgi:hypothetical protein